jgi:hypothetical protein
MICLLLYKINIENLTLKEKDVDDNNKDDEKLGVK